MKRILTIFLVMLLTVGVLGTACKHGHEHEYVQTVVKPTCITKGYTEYVCSCGYKYRDNYVEKLDHKFTNYVDNGNNSSTATCDYGCGREHTVYGENFDWLSVFIIDEIDEAIIGITDYGKTLTNLYVPDEINGNPIIRIGYIASYHSEEDEKIEGDIFNECKNLKSIEIAEGIKYIGDYAFWACRKLESIEMKGVEVTGYKTFTYCESLREIELPNSIKTIGRASFFDCENLRKIVLGENLKEIKDCAFDYCRRLDDITFNGTIEEWLEVERGDYWDGAFEGVVQAAVIHCTDGDVSIDKELN